MVNRMEELSKIRSLNISQDRTTHQYKSRSDAAKPQGDLKQEIYDLYYDIDNTITSALDTTPPGGRILDPDNTNYNQERIFEYCERNVAYLYVANNAPIGGAIIYVICSHKGDVAHFTKERPIYPQQTKTFMNVYELRLRSPVARTPYQVSEYDLESLT